ncbi:MAG: winged helix-turn-helix domain-containing protein [Acidobacteriales bacterium]|nr:winged helix-turn-helix domain-containing protein [Candidatus Koribacter versatilis]MBI3644739.1 winged helix-turn-helix domain-containing protein [Terriglobales bacterium]
MSEGPSSKVHVYRFGAYELDGVTGELKSADNKVQLQDQPLQVLLVLLEHPGELVTREQLVARLWPPQTFVDYDRSLNKAVNKLREALGDSAEEPRFIETLPRKGYRFIVPVEPGATTAEKSGGVVAPPPVGAGRASSWLWISFGVAACLAGVIAANLGGARNWLARARGPAIPQMATLAVLPLENLSRDPEEDYFADGTTDALITNLAKISAARITSRTSVMRYKGTKKSVGEIGRELGVDAIVEGTIQHAGNRIRVTAQLIQVATDMHLWADSYEEDATHILDLQAKVATEIARKINTVVRPLEQAHPVNPQAYGHYLKGRFYFYQYTGRGWQQAIENFRQAIAIDPNFPEAYSGLADSYLAAGAYSVITPQEAVTQGKAAALKALALDDRQAGAHYVLASFYAWYNLDWAKAEAEFQRAIVLNPNDALGRNWHGGYLSLLGRHAEALEEHERARQLDRYSLIINANLARALYWARRYDDAIAQSKRTLQIDPRFGVAALWLEASLRHKGMFKEAVALRQLFNPETAQAVERKFRTQGFQSLLLESCEQFQQNGALVTAARCYAQAQRKEQALTLLETCRERGCFSLATLNIEPDFDVLREEPRFRKLVQGVGLPPK